MPQSGRESPAAGCCDTANRETEAKYSSTIRPFQALQFIEGARKPPSRFFITSAPIPSKNITHQRDPLTHITRLDIKQRHQPVLEPSLGRVDLGFFQPCFEIGIGCREKLFETLRRIPIPAGFC